MKEPSLIHGHVIGRGNPELCYVGAVPLGGPIPGALFNMRGESEFDSPMPKIPWTEEGFKSVGRHFSNRAEIYAPKFGCRVIGAKSLI